LVNTPCALTAFIAPLLTAIDFIFILIIFTANA